MSMPAQERMALRLTCTAQNLVIEMWDGIATPPVRKAPELDAEGGRGLLLVEALSQDWGYYRPWAGGKVVWCALRLTEPSVSLAGGRVVPPGAPPDRSSETLLEPALLMETTETADDRRWLQRVVDGLRELGGWYLPVEDDNDNENGGDGTGTGTGVI
jgi:hypothetical protein